MSRVVSLRFRTSQIERLQRLARRLGRSPSETGALLVEEALRRAEFAHIDFRDSPAGRQAHVQGSSLAVWEVYFIANSYGMDLRQTAAHLDWPEYRVQAALGYATAFPEEIQTALEDNASYDFTALSRMLPHLVPFKAVPQNIAGKRKLQKRRT